MLRFLCPGICAPYHLHWGIVACALKKFLVRIFTVLYASIRFLFLSSVFFFFHFCSFFFVRLESCLQFFSLYLFSDHLDIIASALKDTEVVFEDPELFLDDSVLFSSGLQTYNSIKKKSLFIF